MPAPAYVEHALPGDAHERIALARELDLELELACRDGVVPDPGGLTVVCVQAWDLHREHALHREPAARALAREHVCSALAQAERLGAPRALAVCGFGDDLVDAPFERALAFFLDLAHEARERGRRIVLEPLSPSRAAALTDPGEFARLLAGLPADVFGLALDTGHLMDGGRDPARVLAAWPGAVEELQLRGRDSAPPDDGRTLAHWRALRADAPAAIVVEHAPGRLSPRGVRELVARLRG
jgi:sugar phosphate isomerase/epimerase